MNYGLYTFIVENHFAKYSNISFDFGWGCGYVLLPKEHPFYGMCYDDIHDKYDIRIHGGLTYSNIFESKEFPRWCENREIGGDLTLDNYENFNNYWMIGFDTNHYNDNLSVCHKDYVLGEAVSLLEQCLCDDVESIRKYKYKILRRNKLNRIENI